MAEPVAGRVSTTNNRPAAARAPHPTRARRGRARGEGGRAGRGAGRGEGGGARRSPATRRTADAAAAGGGARGAGPRGDSSRIQTRATTLGRQWFRAGRGRGPGLGPGSASVCSFPERALGSAALPVCKVPLAPLSPQDPSGDAPRLSRDVGAGASVPGVRRKRPHRPPPATRTFPAPNPTSVGVHD